MNIDLPFERGATYFDGDTSRATSTGTNHLLGQTFRVCDNKDGFGNNLKTEKTLVICRNGSSGSLNRGRGVRFATGTSKTHNRIAKGYVNAQGGYGLAIDDAYGASYNIVSNDLFYAVLEGPNKSKSATDTTSAGMLGGIATTWDTTGRIEAAAANDAVNGLLDASNSTGSTNTDVLVYHTSYSNF